MSPPSKEERTVSGKPLRCRICRHHWLSVKNPDGDLYARCQRCGKDRAIEFTGATSGIVGMEKQAIEGFVQERNKKRSR